MATEALLQTISVPAAADLSAKQFYAVTVGSTAALAATGKNADGFLQNKPTSGVAASVAIFGVTKAAITDTITAGALLEVASGGTLINHSSGTIVAKALDGGATGNV